MKKLFLIPVLMLFVSVNMWGELVNVAQVGEDVYKYNSELTKDDKTNKEYKTRKGALAAAFSAVADQGTVKLLADVTDGGGFSGGSKKINFDLNGHKLSYGSTIISIGANNNEAWNITNTASEEAVIEFTGKVASNAAILLKNTTKTGGQLTVGNNIEIRSTNEKCVPVLVQKDNAVVDLTGATCSKVLVTTSKATITAPNSDVTFRMNDIVISGGIATNLVAWESSDLKTSLDAAQGASVQLESAAVKVGSYTADAMKAYLSFTGYSYKSLIGSEYVYILSSNERALLPFEIGEGARFERLEEAIQVASKTSNKVIKLTADYTIADPLSLENTSAGSTKKYDYTIDLNGHNLTTNYVLMCNAKLTLTNSGEGGQVLPYDSNQSILFQLQGYTGDNAKGKDYTVLTIDEGVTLNTTGIDYAISVQPYSGGKSYGVVVNMNGTIVGQSGIYISGTVNSTSTTTADLPQVNVGGTMHTENAPVYAAGYGVWNINDGADLEGSSGVQIKSGVLNVNSGATIHATGEGKRPEAQSGGMIESGAAIQIESKEGYAGNMEINIVDGATVKADGWYAIHEYVANPNDESNVSDINVTGGTFEGGVSVSQDLASEGGFISGGTWTEDVIAYVEEGKTTNAGEGDTYTIGTATAATNLDGTNENTIAEVSADQTVEGNTEVKKLTVENATVTVGAGKTLKVGKGSVLLKEGGKIVVEQGGTLVVDGLVYGANETNFEISTSETAPANVLFSPETEFIKEDHPQATYKFTSKAYNNGAKDIYQRFGVPTFDGNTTMTWENGQNTKVYEYDYSIGKDGNWSKIYEGTSGTFNFENKAPFTCFNMTTTTATAPGTVYTFSGALMGNQDAQLPLVKTWNFMANSYTAPISIYELMQNIRANYGDKVSATAYIYRAEDNWWDVVNLGDYVLNAMDADEYPVPQKEIKPMQAFVLNLYSGTSATPVVNYEENVYNPALGINPTDAPRRAAADNISSAIRMSVANGEYTDNMTLIEGNNFSEAFDNGFDAQKFMNHSAHNLYAQTMNGEMGTMATNNLDGTVLSFNATEAGMYTISFDAVMGGTYALKDNRTNAVINIEAGKSYMFAAEAGVNEARFSIVGRADAPTGVDEVVNVVNGQEGIYTVTGVYVGEKAMLNTLPAGVYVVDGKKIVK